METKQIKILITIPTYSITFQAMDEETRTPMGYISLKFDKGNKAHLMALIRHNDYKGWGITRKLVEEALRFAKAYGIKEIDTGVLNKRSGVIKLLKELGFKNIESDSINHTKLLLEV